MRLRSHRLPLLVATFTCVVAAVPGCAPAQRLRITIPLHSELTPVQRLNREGVDAVLKHRYEKAEGLFYKAYLFDPADPFTLNNLGYVAELQGEVDRAENFYRMATQQGCYATIDRSSELDLRGRPMMDALGSIKNAPMRINWINVLGMNLLAQNRPFEAIAAFQDALSVDPRNAFSLNNLAVAEEATGNFPEALKNYDSAAALQSTAPVIVTRNRAFRGRPVSQVAAQSAQDLRHRTEKLTAAQIRAGMLALTGVSALNRNDWTTARANFVEAYTLSPESAFALNNRGYVAERDGDLESAHAYYARALRAEDRDGRVGAASHLDAQGRQLGDLADASHREVGAELEQYSQRRRNEHPTELKKRVAPGASPQPAPATDKPAEPLTPKPPTP